MVECIIAIGGDIISSARLKKPKTYREIFAILQKASIVSGALSERLQFLAEFRSKLVHAYATISQEKIYHIYTQDIKVVKAFIDVTS